MPFSHVKAFRHSEEILTVQHLQDHFLIPSLNLLNKKKSIDAKFDYGKI